MNRYALLGTLMVSFCAGAGVCYLYNKSGGGTQFSLPAEHGYRAMEVQLDKLTQVDNIIPVAIIGSGPAGLSAALYAARAALYTVVFEGPKPGGQLTTTSYVENWPGTPKSLGTSLIDQTRRQAERFGAVMVHDTVDRVDFSAWPFKLWTSEGKELHALAVIIATGAQSLTLRVPGEQEYWAEKGVSTCAVCDAPYYKDKTVLVVGGGDSAIEEATLLASFAKRVTVLVRKDYMRAAPAMQQRLPNYPTINVVYNTHITKILGDTHQVTHVTVQDTKEQKAYDLPADGVFLAVGHAPSSELFKEYLATDKQGYLQLAPRTQQTSLEGVFAAGDVSDPEFKQAGVAAGDGIKAALGAVNFLRNHGFSGAVEAKAEKRYYELVPDRNLEIKALAGLKDVEKLLSSTKSLVVLDFYAPWCVSCTHMLPVVSAVAAQLEGKAVFAKVNTGDSKVIAEKYNVPNVPWLLVFKDGKELGRTNSIMTKRQLYMYVQQFMQEDK